MLIRIVKLTFKPENIASFEQIFEASKSGILAFEGCNMVELYHRQGLPSGVPPVLAESDLSFISATGPG